MKSEALRFIARTAWVDGGWKDDVLLGVDGGAWSEVIADADASASAGATPIDGPVLPGLVNAHSHAFQRAIAGLTEHTSGGDDDFWSWRDRMYRAANRITPVQLEAIAAFLYAELLRAGYTQVCEFHYLHNDCGGKTYADPLETSLALVRAARRTGIGLTLLPTLYMRSGFAANGLRDDQLRFASTPASVARIAESIERQVGRDDLINAGLALHSLRAVDPSAMKEAASAARSRGWPIHIHAAEQQREVEECVAATGLRPIEWLLQHLALDASWNLVHATQAAGAELDALRPTGASIVLCPSTEANLGDGIFDLPTWTALGGSWSVGSDSHVSRSWIEELRLLEYSQRLARRRRNVAARSTGTASTAASLFDAALAGGKAASGQSLQGIAPGQRADFVVVDRESPALIGVPAQSLLDALIFSSPAAPLKQVFVAGRLAAGGGSEGGNDDALAEGFRSAMEALWHAA